MKKLHKTFVSIVFIVALLAACFIGVSRTLAPHIIKAELTKQVYQLTGRSLIINGDVVWTFFPWLGIKVQDVALDNTSEFEQIPLVKAKDVHLNVKLLPLFSRRIEVGEVVIDGFTIHLIKNANGKTNWTNLLIDSQHKSKSVDIQQEENAKFSIYEIKTVNLQHGKVSFVDKQQHKNIQLDELNFNAENLAQGKDFPFKLSFDFKQGNDSLAGNLHINGLINVDSKKNIFNFPQLILDSSFIDSAAKKHLLHGTGNLTYLIKKAQFSLQNLTVKLDNYNIKGALTGTINPIFSAQGYLQTPSLQIGKFLFKDVQTRINIKNSIIALNSLTAHLYGGNYTGDIVIDYRLAKPTVRLNGMLMQADAGLLFTDVLGKSNSPFSGALDMSTMLKFTLGQVDSIQQTLNGNITIKLQNGALHGINIPAFIELGQAIIKHTDLPTPANNQTDFGLIKGNFHIQNGVMNNQDLTLKSSQLTANGHGTIDLPAEQISYHLNTGLIGHKTQVPILIQGSFNQLRIIPDTSQIAKKVLTDQLVDVIDKVAKSSDKEKVQQLKEKLGEQLLGAISGQ